MRTLFLILVYSLMMMQLGCSALRSGSNAGASNTETNQSSPTLPVFASAPEALAAGNQLLDQGETVQAIDALLQAVKFDPDLAEAYFKLGIAYSLVEAKDQTVKEPIGSDSPDKKAQEKKTNSVKAFENAVAGYKKIIAADKDDADARFNLGLAYNKLNEDEDAAKSLKEAARLKPEDTEYQTELGSILIKLAKYHEAIGPLKKALEIDPDNIKAQDLLEKADAGSKRVDYRPAPPEEKKSGDSNSAVDDEDDTPAANESVKPTNQKALKTPEVARPDDKKKSPTPAKTPKKNP